jgi:hypothetical protein
MTQEKIITLPPLDEVDLLSDLVQGVKLSEIWDDAVSQEYEFDSMTDEQLKKIDGLIAACLNTPNKDLEEEEEMSPWCVKYGQGLRSWNRSTPGKVKEKKFKFDPHFYEPIDRETAALKAEWDTEYRARNEAESQLEVMEQQYDIQLMAFKLAKEAELMLYYKAKLEKDRSRIKVEVEEELKKSFESQLMEIKTDIEDEFYYKFDEAEKWYRDEIATLKAQIATLKASPSPMETPPMKKEYERSTMNLEEQFATCLNELRRKREAAEKQMIRDYMMRERNWRAAEAQKPAGVSQQFLWNEARRERERAQGVKLEVSKTLYEFVSSTMN